jgi:hypothetical protein
MLALNLFRSSTIKEEKFNCANGANRVAGAGQVGSGRRESHPRRAVAVRSGARLPGNALIEDESRLWRGERVFGRERVEHGGADGCPQRWPASGAKIGWVVGALNWVTANGENEPPCSTSGCGRLRTRRGRASGRSARDGARLSAGEVVTPLRTVAR